MSPIVSFICPQHRFPLNLSSDKASYNCLAGCRFEIRNQIPRFVSPENYAKSFGLQWNTFRKTQLDSFTGTSISRDRLTRISGGNLGIFCGKTVLEAGCGAGRFTEIMLDAGANVWAVDLSTAVDANYENCHNKPGYSVCQADILSLPFPQGQFDIVVCIGVIQHTPDPEETVRVLCSYLKPGGWLLIDHYAYGYAVTPSRKRLREFLITKRETFALCFVLSLSIFLWPFHIALHRARNIKSIKRIRTHFLEWSPLVDYQDAYPTLGSELLYQWAVLDTYDTLTDHFKHLRSADELEAALETCRMTEIETAYAGNGVEARARKLE